MFAHGFAAGSDGITSTYCLFGEQLQDPILVARSHGFEDGQAAAAVAHFVNRDPSMEPSTCERLCSLLATPGPIAWSEAQEVLEEWLASSGLDLESAPLQSDATLALVLNSCRELGPRRAAPKRP